MAQTARALPPCGLTQSQLTEMKFADSNQRCTAKYDDEHNQEQIVYISYDWGTIKKNHTNKNMNNKNNNDDRVIANYFLFLRV